LSLGRLLTAYNNEPNEFLTKNDNPGQETVIYETSYKTKLEQQLAALLQQVNGVGDVNVMITLEDETLIEPAFNTFNTEKNSEERDNEGGVRTVIEKQINKQAVLLRKSGDEEPMVLKKTTPRIKGILIVAEGAFSSKIKEKIIKSTATLLDIPIYKISVLAK
jgi:stage III sporulation protein AG